MKYFYNRYILNVFNIAYKVFVVSFAISSSAFWHTFSVYKSCQNSGFFFCFHLLLIVNLTEHQINRLVFLKLLKMSSLVMSWWKNLKEIFEQNFDWLVSFLLVFLFSSMLLPSTAFIGNFVALKSVFCSQFNLIVKFCTKD